MADRRFDYRSKDTFKKDIKFGTMLEKYFFDKWIDVAQSQGISLTEWSNNGCDNDGEYIETGRATGGALPGGTFTFPKGTSQGSSAPASRLAIRAVVAAT